MAELQNKHLLIVGGSSGIGFAIAQRAGLEGARLTLMGRSQQRLDEARAMLKAQNIKVCETLACDAHDHDALQALRHLIIWFRWLETPWAAVFWQQAWRLSSMSFTLNFLPT